MEEKDLVQRMYSIVLYNISPIQQGIQTTHAVVEYAQAYFSTLQYQKWAQVDKTLIMLNGGSSIKLKEHMDYLIDNQIVDLAFFKEPDLFGGITAFCFLADERIWDREKYPDRLAPLDGVELPGGGSIVNAIHRVFDLEGFKEQIGGEKNFLLKEFLSKFRKA
jgi:hypothetical protein